MSRKAKAGYSIIFILALAVRIWWVIRIPSVPLYDFQTYYDIGVNVFSGQGITLYGEPAAFQGPAYPWLLGKFFALCGRHSLFLAKVMNIPFSMGTLALCLVIYRKLLQGEIQSMTALGMTAFLPHYIAYNNVVGNEILFTFLFAGLLCLLLYDFPWKYRGPALGVLIGAAALTKPYMVAFPAVVFMAEWMQHKTAKKAVLLAGTAAGIMILCILPWTVRNYRAYHQLIPVSYNAGYVFFVNNNANNTTGIWMPLSEALEGTEVQAQAEEILQEKDVKLAWELNSLLKGEAVRWALSNPVAYLELGMLRMQEIFFSGAWDIDSWAMNEFHGVSTTGVRHKNTLAGLFHMISLVLNSIGIFYTLLNLPGLIFGLFKRRRLTGICVPQTAVLFIAAIYFFMEGQARYNFPLLFLFVLFLVLTGNQILSIKDGNTDQDPDEDSSLYGPVL